MVDLVKRHLASNSFVTRAATRDEAASVLAFLDAYFEDNADVDQIRGWIAKFTNSITLIASAETQNRVGVFKTLPLSLGACKLVEEGALTGTSIQAEHMVSELSSASGLWIGDLAVAGSAYQRGVILAAHLLPMLRQSAFTGMIYARASKKDGFDLLMRYGFEPLNSTLTGDAAKTLNDGIFWLNRVMKRPAR